MKRYISRSVKTVAYCFLAFPLFYILFAAMLFNIPASNWVRVLLAPSYYLLCLFAMITGYALLEVRRPAWYLFLITNVFMFYENALLVTEYGETEHKVMSFITAVLMQALLTVRVAREIRVPYFFPKIRWWESDPRYRLSVPVKIKRKDGKEMDGDILDLSLGGCFVKLRSDIDLYESVSTQFQVFGFNIKCEAVVVWRTQSTVTHPRGIGLKFEQLPRTERRSLRQVNQRLKKIAALYRRSRYLLNQEEFFKRIEEIEKAPNKRLKLG